MTISYDMLILTINLVLRFSCPRGDLGDLASSYPITIGNIVFFPQRLLLGVESVPSLSLSIEIPKNRQFEILDH